MDACGETSSSDSEPVISSSSTSEFSDGPGASGPLFKVKDSLESGELMILPPLQAHLPTLSEIIRNVRERIVNKAGPNHVVGNSAAAASGAIRPRQDRDHTNETGTKTERRINRKRPFSSYKRSGSLKSPRLDHDPESNLEGGDALRKRNGDPGDIVYSPSVSDVSSDSSREEIPFKRLGKRHFRGRAKRNVKVLLNRKSSPCNGQQKSSSSSKQPDSSSSSGESDTTDTEQEAEDTRADVLNRLFLNKVCKLGSARCTHVQLCTYKGSYINHAVAKFYPKNSPRFDRELEALKRLRHKSILKMIDARSYSDQRVLILRYCNNGNLAAYIGKLCLATIVNHFYKISSALYYMHEKNFIHGDIKLENILLDMIFEPMLSDFDLTERLAPGENQIKGRRGTEGFIAPEMYDNPKGVYNGYRVRYFL